MDPSLTIPLFGTSPLHEETRWNPQTMYRLPRSQQTHDQEPLPAATHRRITGKNKPSNLLHQSRSTRWIPPPSSRTRRGVENRIPLSIWTLRIPSDALRSL